VSRKAPQNSRKEKKRRAASEQGKRFPKARLPKEGSSATSKNDSFLLGSVWQQKAPLILYGGKFVLLSILLYSIVLLPSLGNAGEWFARQSARGSTLVLHLLGERCQSSEETIYSPHFAITVAPLCTNGFALCLFAAAVVVFPATWKQKLCGLLVGVLVLSLLNLLRIVSLYFTGVHFPSLFDAMHEQVWGYILTPSTFLLFLGWMQWVLSSNKTISGCQ